MNSTFNLKERNTEHRRYKIMKQDSKTMIQSNSLPGNRSLDDISSLASSLQMKIFSSPHVYLFTLMKFCLDKYCSLLKPKWLASKMLIADWSKRWQSAYSVQSLIGRHPRFLVGAIQSFSSEHITNQCKNKSHVLRVRKKNMHPASTCSLSCIPRGSEGRYEYVFRWVVAKLEWPVEEKAKIPPVWRSSASIRLRSLWLIRIDESMMNTPGYSCKTSCKWRR